MYGVKQRVFSQRRGLSWVSLAAVTACMMIWPLRSFALDFISAYRSALHKNPAYLATQQQHLAAQEKRVQGRGGLLPTLSLNYSQAYNWSEVEQQSGANRYTEDRDYQSHNASLMFQQPLLDYEAWSGYQKADQQAQEADDRFLGETAKLALQVLTSYTQAMLARDQQVLAEQQLAAHRALLHQNESLKAQGEGTQTDVLETQSRLFLSETEWIEAQDALDLALRALARVVDLPVIPSDLPELISFQASLPLDSSELEYWQRLALQHNPELLALAHREKAAEYEVSVQNSGHYPRLSLYASSRRTESDTENTYEQRYDTESVGIQLKVPLYLGGRVSSAAREAQAIKSQVSYELASKRQEVMLNVRRHLQKCISSVSSLKARRFALSSSEALVTATRMSVQGGERGNQDVLDAERQWYQARRELARTQYDYLQAWLALHVEAGVLQDAHIVLVSEQFRRVSKNI